METQDGDPAERQKSSGGPSVKETINKLNGLSFQSSPSHWWREQQKLRWMKNSSNQIPFLENHSQEPTISKVNILVNNTFQQYRVSQKKSALGK